MSEKPQSGKPFVRTHARHSDGLAAMLLAKHDGNALYRVQWTENGKRHDNTLVRPAAVFDALFRRVA
jgi:hypothetical protein